MGDVRSAVGSAVGREMMNTHEVAEYLRIKERKVYNLVRERRIPCTRVTGKWLFPKPLIDQWVAAHADFPAGPSARPGPVPAVVVGSHDPLLDWAIRESGCDLAILSGGSLDGLKRLAAGEAMVCGLHVFDPDSGEYNVPVVTQSLAHMGMVMIEWAWRDQGLALAPGNPLGIRGLADLVARKARVVERQHEAGSRLLFVHLLSEAGVRLADLDLLPGPARSETDLCLAVVEGKADAGLAVAAAARQYRLDFLPLHRERFDLVLRRRDYFEPAFQTLLAFTRTPAFAARAAEMGGYDIARLGRVVHNG